MDRQAVDVQEHLSGIERLLKEVIAGLLQEAAETLDSERSFTELGVHSLLAVEVIEATNQALGIDLGVEVIFDYHCIRELTHYICDQYASVLEDQQLQGQPSPAVDPQSALSVEARESDIAIIGISGKFARSYSIANFWTHLLKEELCIGEIERSGWDEQSYYAADALRKQRSISKWGGMLADIDLFDASFFGISDAEATSMDPQQRLLVQEAFKAIEDGGYATDQLAGRRVGVFVGGRQSNYKELALAEGESSAHLFLGNEVSMLAARLSYLLNIKGPSLVIDTACSSSLVAIHLACESIRRGESEMALAGSVFVLPSPEFFVLASPMGTLSPDGTCRTFDQAANGMVLAEGVGVVLLKSVRQARADRDHIYGVIKGSTVNQTGRANGLTAPSMQAQKELITTCYKDADIDPRTISYIEVHGTATNLGDAIEVKALTEAFRSFTPENHFCLLGSHKPTFGHAVLASGMASLFKVLLAMQYHVLPTTIGVKELNKHIDMKNSPFVINTQQQEWRGQDGRPLRAGINSFGSSGTNCHMILEEALPLLQRDDPQDRLSYLLPFSARSKSDLEQKLRDMETWLARESDRYAFADIAYTLSVGRSHWPVRCVLLARNSAELQQKIHQVYEAGMAEDYFSNAETQPAQSDSAFHRYAEQIITEVQQWRTLAPADYKEKLSILADLYCNLAALPWEKLWSNATCQRVPLPAYPLRGKRYWFTRKQQPPPASLPSVPSQDGAVSIPFEQTYLRSRREMDELLGMLLWVQLRSGGFFKQEQATLAELSADVALLPRYERWLVESLTLLVDQHYLASDGVTYRVLTPVPLNQEHAWSQWESKKAAWLSDPNLRGQVVLVEEVLRALPAILTGKRPATDILFPQSSMERVQNIYTNNPLADYYNGLLAERVVSCVQQRLSAEPAARLRLLEIGAGTGGTSAIVFQRLQSYQTHIAEYCYTDLSQAFLLYARKMYGAQYPYLQYKIFDIEQSATTQNIDTGYYDIVIAANVLHATRNIQQTIRHTKALLRKGGLLLLNELSSKSPFLHLTFGLTEGWWLYEDDEVRLLHSPVLAPATWQRVLSREGFAPVEFLRPETHALGQQVLAAESDGIVHAAPQRDAVPAQSRASAPLPSTTKQGRPFSSFLSVTDQMVEDYVRETLLEKLAEALEIHPDAVDVERAFRSYGLDSILGVNFIQKINQVLHIELETIVLFDYSSVRSLTAYIVDRYNDALCTTLAQQNKQEQRGEAVVQLVSQAVPSPMPEVSPLLELRQEAMQAGKLSEGMSQPEAIAIIGMSGRFAQSNNVDALWQHLAAGASLIRPFADWDLRRLHSDGQPSVSQGALLEDIELFDPLFFNISGLEATYMDPQQRLFLEEAWKSLEDAGYAGEAIAGQRCGIYVGCTKGDYQQVIGDDAPAQAFWGNMESVVSSRIAYYLDLQGPAITVDTACSSSLVAIHLACQGLRLGEVEIALAGGVFVQATPAFYLAAHRAGMVSPTGYCYTFDERADGFAMGEGVGAVVLKRLSAALADGDHIHGVIRGIGINQDGATNGITAPSAKSQERLERNVYDTFHIDPQHVHMVEAHGTGTPLGDPIEFQALTRAFRHYTAKKQYCAIGSVKTNLGHTQIASGMAGLLKILLSLRHRQIPPSLHFQQCNSNIALADSPFYVNTQLRPWEIGEGEIRCAVLSAFGASGTNAHVVLEEAPSVERHHFEKPGYLIVLSARTPEQLRQQAEQLVAFCQNAGNELDCGNMSYTLLMGRKHLSSRLACVVHEVDELLRIVTRWLEKGKLAQVYVSETNGQAYREQPALKRYGNQCILNCQQEPPVSDYLEQLATIAELYVQGYALNFVDLFAQAGYSRMSLPTYPFARERYWASERQRSPRSTAPGAVASRFVGWLHPLLQQNTSDFSLQRFTSQWSGQEFFLSDHVVGGQRVLPGVAYLEMARVACAYAAGSLQGQVYVSLTDVVWATPIVAGDEAKQVHIRLIPQDDGSISYDIYSLPEEDAEPLLYSQGKAILKSSSPPAKRSDLSLLQEQCNLRVISGEEFYTFFSRIGIDYGPSHRGIERLYRGVGQVLAKLVLPAFLEDTCDQFILHPCLMDSALQATVELLMDSEKVLAAGPEAYYQPVMPFALEELEIAGSCVSPLWAWVRYSAGSQAGGLGEKFDIDLYNEQGEPQVSLRGFSARRLEGQPHDGQIASHSLQSEAATSLLTPIWDVVQPARERPTASAGMLIVGVASEQRNAIQQLYPDAAVLLLRPHEDIQSMVNQLRTYEAIEHIVWLAPPYQHALLSEEAMITEQDQGVLHLFRMVKALLILGFGEKTPGWTIITTLAQPVHMQEQVCPIHASVHGFVGSLAREYPRWSLRLVDLPQQERWPLSDVFTLPAIAHGHAWSYRHGRWYQQQLLPLQKPVQPKTLYRHNGVYVVIGGAGGIGEVWSEYMLRTYQAQIVWIGRRPLDEAIQARIERLATLGPAPCYIVADATDHRALEQGYVEIKRRYGQIHGVIHSAIALLDKSLANMDEERFRRGLAAKVDVCVRIAQVFAREPLNFALFFSSINSFTKSAGQSNYAAGSTFEDAFAHQLAHEWPCAVKMINWGYWGSVGVVASPFYQERMEQAGVGSIDPAEGMQALELLLAGPVDHLVAMKATKSMVLDGMNREETLTLYPEKTLSIIEQIKDSLPEQALQLAYLQTGKGQ